VVPVAWEVTWIAQFIGSPLVRVGRGGLFKPVAAIEVAIFPDAVGDAVGVGDALALGDAVGVGDALALGDGVALVTADDVVVAVVDVVFVLATCGLV
jgi:hypothetical protein